MFNFLYIRHAFILWDIYPISYRYGFFPRPANRNLQCKLNLPIRLVLGHMSEITLKILMKSGTFGLCQNKIDGFFFSQFPVFFFFFFFWSKNIAKPHFVSISLAPLGRVILKNAKRSVK